MRALKTSSVKELTGRRDKVLETFALKERTQGHQWRRQRERRFDRERSVGTTYRGTGFMHQLSTP